MLQLKDVKKIYTTKAGEVHALNGVSITFPSTGLVFITGKSGCGKTTLLNVIGGLDGIDEGEIYIQDKQFSTFSAQEYDSYRNTFVGFVFQEYNLLSEFTVEHNIKIAMELQGREMDEEALEKLLQDVGIENLRNRKPSELSGGQRQRVAIARALVKEPRIIMADEPTGALDGATGIQVLETLKKLSKDKLIIVVSHDIEFAEKYADRIIHLVDGQVVEDMTFNEKELATNVNDKESVLIVKEGAELSEDEKDVLAKAIKERKKIEFTEKVCFRDRKPTGKVKKDESTPVAFKKSRMKLRSSAQIGVKSLTVKPIRLIITIIISALAFAVFGLFDTIANFSAQSVLRNHIKKIDSTIVARADYIVDYQNNDIYTIKMSQEAVKAMESEMGGTVKGIFDFDDTMHFKNYTQVIQELTTSKVVVGKSYYAKDVLGFIEFDHETEIDAEGNFKDFNYRLIAGRYPKVVVGQGEKKEEESLREIAISKYLAESIVHYLDGAKYGDKIITTPTDLCNSEITVDNRVLKIVGIIDCGEIPARYAPIKTSNPDNMSLSSLISDYNAYINSSAQKCLFVGKGFREGINRIEKSGDICYRGNASGIIQIEHAEKTERLNLTDYVYSARGYDKNNILLFSGEYAEDGKVALKDDEVLIHPLNFKEVYKDVIYQLEKEKREEIISKIEGIPDLSADKVEATFHDICTSLNIQMEDNCIPVSLSYKSSKTDTTISKKAKIVGLYFGIGHRSYTDIKGTVFKLMMNDSLMQSLCIYPEQGDFSKVLFSEKSIENGSDAIVDYFLKEEGLALSWYNNSVLAVIADNESMIKQAADLFLYVALALAVFSIFMLYNYISTSIASKQRSVGVLRGLGAGGKDILLIFLTESLIIGIINGVLANLLSWLGCFLVNSYIMNKMSIFVSFALFGIRQILMITGLSLLTAVLASALPIFKISKKKPVDLIRRA